ncbi:hypothetical protein DSO57_1037594 [Entomophthora muscae]|uniref:Uncharacterized protein n=1 Tax=Entomophthora muscae TaxID=34485 RepID=A0ACC2RDL3_9FUNG|nr:hypothetical protein DSO57_1037594 [Entomophthora muscae]
MLPLLCWIFAAVVLGQKEFLAKFKELTGRGQKRFGPLTRVVAGKNANPFEYPFMVYFRLDKISDDDYLCGGTALNSHLVLTAAHCLHKNYVDRFSVHSHRHDKSVTPSKEKGGVHGLDSIVIHEKYDDSGDAPQNDIAIAKLIQPMKISKFVLLPSATMKDPSLQADLTVVGWGLTYTGGEGSDVLQKAEHLHLTNSCFSRPELKKNTHLCATSEFGQDACTNDSGGPLLLLSGKSMVQIGIVSTGAACGVAAEPGIYTKLSGYAGWIQTTSEKLNT